jgi:hypothetical protein
MSSQFYAPLDPECPEVMDFSRSLMDDPMTQALSAPVDEILDDWARKHRQKCPQCRDYGLANISCEVEKGKQNNAAFQ